MSRGPHAGPRLARPLRWWQLLATGFGLYWVCGVAGCAGDGPPPKTGGEYDAIQADIFNVHCLGSGCHNVLDKAGGLVLEAGLSYDDLVDVPPENLAARDAGMLRVRALDATGSFLLTKLIGPAAGEGSAMPLGSSPLAAGDIDRIRDWILAGAPPPATPPPGASID
ncbi:hypothetical protein L6Q96_04385 [Candidatus Binatia bacterium]|nr:hypothetical protein [Candidatus Binatia bacterium]